MAAYDEIKEDARSRLGRLFDPGDYPHEVRGLFGVDWDFPSVEPPSHLLRIAPEVYEQERRRVAARFDEAVRLAEQAFAAEFTRLLSHLTERLGECDNGRRKVFRDSAVANLSEFFQRLSTQRAFQPRPGPAGGAGRRSWCAASRLRSFATTTACGGWSPRRWPACRRRWSG